MKRQNAFESTGNRMLKGALHCHTTRSDGRGTPEAVIAKHADHGYDFMALTDHRVYNMINHGDRPMTIIPGMELDSNFPEMFTRGVHCHHIVCIGPLEGNGFHQDQRFPRKYITRRRNAGAARSRSFQRQPDHLLPPRMERHARARI